MLVTIIARHLCTINRNAIVLLTVNQKYYGLKLLYEYLSCPRSAFCLPLIPDRKKPHSRFENAAIVLFMHGVYQYIPPIPPAPAAAAASAASAFGSFLSATRLSVVSTIDATEAAF